MNIGPTNAKAADPGAARRLAPPLVPQPFPDLSIARQSEGCALRFQIRILASQMTIPRDQTVLHHQQHLDQTGDAGRRLGMPDIGLDRSKDAVRLDRSVQAAFPIQRFERAAQPIELDRITQLGTRAMDFDITHRSWIDPRSRIGIHQE